MQKRVASENSIILKHSEIGSRMRALRGERTQAEFAESLGISRGYYAILESGKQPPSREVLMKLREITGCSIDGMLGIGEEGVAYVTKIKQMPALNDSKLSDERERLSILLKDPDLHNTNLEKLATDPILVNMIGGFVSDEFEALLDWLKSSGDQALDAYIHALQFYRTMRRKAE
jgi:transcriptional regulator with XRE-family HTH domain